MRERYERLHAVARGCERFPALLSGEPISPLNTYLGHTQEALGDGLGSQGRWSIGAAATIRVANTPRSYDPRSA
eukprot:13934872-Alexandrium_andersonii.AAC.1